MLSVEPESVSYWTPCKWLMEKQLMVPSSGPPYTTKEKLNTIRDQNGFRPKSLKARNSGLGGVCTCMLNGPQMKRRLPRGVWGLVSRVAIGAFQCHFGSLYSNTPTPSPLKKILFRFTLISRMVLGVGKKSEIRLKSENFDP